MSDWFFVVIPLGFGIAFAAGGVHRYRAGRAFLATAHRVPGIVTGTHRVSRTDRYEYFAKLRFHTLDGVEVETVGRTSSGSYELTRLHGQRVWVLYDPANPREARMDTLSGRGLGGAVAMVAGGCGFVLIGVAALIVMAL